MNWKKIGLIAAALLVFFWLIKAPIASWYLSDSMKVPVHMSTLTIWPSETTIHNFSIKNPKGFQSRNALSISKTEVDYKISELKADPCVIDLIKINDITLTLEFSNPLGTESNWTVISNGMSSDKQNKKKEEKKSDSKGVLVHKIEIFNLTVETKGLAVATPPKHYDYLEMNELSSKDGFPTSLVLRGIFDQADLNKYLPKDFQMGTDMIKNALHLN
jgi:hypothetical protein